MATVPYMPLYVADYLADTPHLSALGHGAYLLLLMTYWQSRKPVPDDDRKLARICRMTDDEWESVRDDVREFFVARDGVLIQGRMQIELEKIGLKTSAAANAGRISAERRANARSTPVEQTLNHTGKIQEDSRDANASLVDGEPPTPEPPVASSPELPLADPIKLDLERNRIAEARSRMREVAEAWNELAGSLHLPQIEEIKAGSAREKAALARIREGADFDRVFARIRGSPFLRGDRGHSPAAFDWIMNPTNLTKILEGNYEDRKAKR